MSSSGGGSSSTPRIMVFRPTMEEFKDFPKYIEKMESCGAHRAGLAKIIPPEGWCPRKNGYDDVDIVIPSPISQVVNGRQGLYQQFNIQKKAMTVKEFQKLAECSKYKTPQHFDYEDLERKYWKNITYNPPIYGADVSGSLYSDGVKEFNIQKLNTILDMVKEGYEIQIEGVNTAYLYFGMWKTTFAWHTEDMDLYSINYLHFGAPKSWYAIPPEHGRRLERLAAGFFHGSYNSCQAFLRHKMTIISPQILKQYSIPYNKITQEPGEFMITFPFGYHSGFNHGFNCAESTNFATERWVEYGKRTISCTCRNDCVKICMDMFVRKFQPDKYEKWLNGKDMGTHPEDPSKHSAAPAPNKLELAIAAQRERKRAKHIENTSKIKRHPISKTGKNGEKYKIQSATNDTLENSNDGDSKETEIYDVDEAIQNKPSGKKNQAKREASPITPKKQTKESDQDLIEHDQKDTSKTSNTFKDTIIKQEKNMYAEKKSTFAAIENVPDNPPDLKPFWDQEMKKSKKMDSSVSSNEKNVIKTENTEIFSKFPHLKHAVTNGALAITTVKLESPKSVHFQSSTPNSNQSKAEFSTLNSARKLQRDQSFSPSLTNKTIAVPFCSSPTSISKDIPNEYCSVVLRNWSNSGNWKCEHTQGLKVKFVQPKPFSNPMITQPISSEGDSPKINQLGHLTTASGVNSGISITPLPSPMQVEHSKTSSSKQSKKSKRGSKKNQDNQPCSSSDNIKPADDCLDNWAGPISKLWQHRPLDFEAECNFNMHCSTIKPHCAVCSIFSSANISVTFPTEQPEVPSYSKVKMPAFCFANGVDNQCILDTNPLLARDGSAPLITCSNCKVSVHATCYGVTMLQMGPWLCTRCANHAENAECCLCVLRGGALKPTNDGRWAHITCAILIPETCFENIVFKEPINVSRLTAVRQRLKCKYCFKSSPVQNNAGGACIQCLSGKCYMPFHVTCGHMAGVIYEANDWPEPINIVCTRHASARRKPVKRQFTNIDVGDTVLAKHKNRRYYSVRVKEKFLQEYYSVLFDDNSTSTNTLPEDIVKRESTLIGRPELDEKIQVKWTDEKIYNGLFKGFNCCETYVVEFDDGTVLSQERHQIYATDEFIPKEIKSKWSHSTESRHVGLFTAETEGKRLRISNTKYKSFTS